MDLDSGFHIQVRYKLSKIKWINLGFILHKHVKIPSFQVLSAHRVSICPQLYKFPREEQDVPITGSFANLTEELVLHFCRLLQFEGHFLESIRENCCIKILGGLDCAGDQKEYQQRSQLNIETSHVENGSYCLTSIHLDPSPSTEEIRLHTHQAVVNADQENLEQDNYYDAQAVSLHKRKETLDRSWFGTWRDNVKVWSAPSADVVGRPVGNLEILGIEMIEDMEEEGYIDDTCQPDSKLPKIKKPFDFNFSELFQLVEVVHKL